MTNIALVGNPNVGKSTLFNGVTGARQAVINAPGTTVEFKSGNWKSLGIKVVDLPGTYSLIPDSPDEKVVSDVLAGAEGAPVEHVLAVLDGGALTRSLYLLAQLGQTGYPVAAVISMADVAADNGVQIDADAISRAIGIPVMVFDARNKRDYPKLDAFVQAALDHPARIRSITPDPTAPGFNPSVAGAGAGSEGAGGGPEGAGAGAGAETAAEGAARIERDLEEIAEAKAACNCGHAHASSLDLDFEGSHAEQAVGRLVGDVPESGSELARTALLFEWVDLVDGQIHAAGGDGVAVDAGADMDSGAGADAGAGIENLGASATAGAALADHFDAATSVLDSADAGQAGVVGKTNSKTRSPRAKSAPVKEPGGPSRSDRVDRVLLNPVVGPLVFLVLMWLLFKLAGEWVGPVQDYFDGLFSSDEEGAFSLANGLTWLLGLVGLEETWVESLLVGGLATGLGVVASFVPLMFTIFVALSILEDSGYMARAAFLADRLMRRIGLDGRVVLPLIMGFGCNLPSLAAARTLPSARQRLVTVLITPYTSCAARLTIYLMIAKIFFPNNAGTVVFAMYMTSIVLVVLAAWVLKFFITKHEAESPLMLILPAYQVPRVGAFVRNAALRSWMFIKGAGKIIVVMTMAVWVLGAIPIGAGDKGFADPELPMEDSAYGQVAKLLEPAFAPAGFDDWHMTGALMTGFVAKETVVSSIVTSYNMDPEAAGDAEDNGDDLGVLPSLLHETFTETAGEGNQGVAALAFLVFVLAYTPCLATVAEQARLIGGKKTAIAVAVQLVVAWALAVGVFQIGRLFV